MRMGQRRRPLALMLAGATALAACADGDDDAAPATTGPVVDSVASPVSSAISTAGATVASTGPATGATTGGPTTNAAGVSTTAVVSASIPPSTTTVGAAGASTSIVDVAPTVVLDDALLAVLDRIPAWLADAATVDESMFGPDFLADVPIDAVRAGLASLGGGSWTVSNVQPLTETALAAVVTGPDLALRVQLEVDAEGHIATLFFENAGLLEPPESMDDLIAQLEAGGERTGLLVADVTDGAGATDDPCAATTDRGANDVLPIASTFKLYVLGALATAIDAGTISWDQAVAIRDELDSPGIGETLDAPAGSTVAVRDLAQRMIEVSDNTATDHLIDLLGRDAVEATLVDFGHHDPAVTLPLLTTREMSIVKADTELLGRFAAADEAGRRSLLAEEVAAAPAPTVDDIWSEPRAVTEVEWFATPADLCRAFAGLLELSGRPGLEPLSAVLSANPGMLVDPARFAQVWFKGGSEPGVLVGAWLVQRADGTWFVVAGGAASTTAPIDPAVIELVGSAIDLGG